MIVRAPRKIRVVTHRVTKTLTHHVIACTRMNRRYCVSRRVKFVGFNSHMSMCLPLNARIYIAVKRLAANGRAIVTGLGWGAIAVTVTLGGCVPGTVAYLGLFSNYVTSIVTFRTHCSLTLAFVVLDTIFSFFSNVLTHALGTRSPVKGSLSSLTSSVDFNITPSFIVFSLLGRVRCPTGVRIVTPCLPCTTFLVSIFSNLQLTGFGGSAHRADSFVNLPIPTGTLF